jgi:hypothetical protein
MNDDTPTTSSYLFGRKLNLGIITNNLFISRENYLTIVVMLGRLMKIDDIISTKHNKQNY